MGDGVAAGVGTGVKVSSENAPHDFGSQGDHQTCHEHFIPTHSTKEAYSFRQRL